MKKCIEVIDKLVSNISENFLKFLFSAIIILMGVINSIYLYIDTPDFKINNVWNYLGIIINIIIGIGIVKLEEYLSKKIPKGKNIIIITFLIYFILEIIFIYLVPIVPFSDMYYVTDIALSDFSNNIEYLQRCTNNLPIIMIFNLIFKILSYDVIHLKILNIICNIITIYFSYKLYKNIYSKDNKLVIFLGVTSISTFLYVNNTYNDIIFVTLITIILYLATKEIQSKGNIILISILSFLQFIIRPVGIILIIALCMYYIFKEKNLNNVMILGTIFIVLYMLYGQVKNQIIPKSETVKEYPVWSYIQMGINEAEFGFQDSTHSADWTLDDVINRLDELGIKRLIKLLAKNKHGYGQKEHIK